MQTILDVRTRIDSSMNPWSPYLLSILRIIAAFVDLVHGTQKLFDFPAPFPEPHLPIRRLYSLRRDGSCLLHVPRSAGILAAAERWGRRGALLLHFSISREHGRRAVES